MNGFFVARRLAVVALSMFALSVQASAQTSLNLPKGASLALLVTAGAVGDASGFKLTGTMQLPACNVAHVQQIRSQARRSAMGRRVSSAHGTNRMPAQYRNRADPHESFQRKAYA